jgi:hypothetical protein
LLTLNGGGKPTLWAKELTHAVQQTTFSGCMIYLITSSAHASRVGGTVRYCTLANRKIDVQRELGRLFDRDVDRLRSTQILVD